MNDKTAKNPFLVENAPEIALLEQIDALKDENARLQDQIEQITIKMRRVANLLRPQFGLSGISVAIDNVFGK
jgi:hypothetical protein